MPSKFIAWIIAASLVTSGFAACVFAATPQVEVCADATYGVVPLTVGFTAQVCRASPVDFRTATLESYEEDVACQATVGDEGASLSLAGNGAKAFPLPYQVTRNTVVEFDFCSAVQGETHAIGLDDDKRLSGERMFVVYGQEPWGADVQHCVYRNYSSPAGAWQHFRIPIGQFYTGRTNYLVLMNDQDVPNPTAKSSFRNVTVYETDERFDPTKVTWDFGDGQQMSGDARPTHTYNTPGLYTATLIVTDAEEQARRQVQIRVKQTMVTPRSLFFDDGAIEKIENLQRVLNQPLKHPYPVITHDRPWDAFRPQVHGTAMYDATDKRFKMWYLAIPSLPISGEPPPVVGGIPRIQCTTLVGYAVSKDGLNWEKPNLGQVDFNGSKETSLLNMGRDNTEGVSVLCEPNDPDPQRRYKAIYWEHTVPVPGRAPLADPRPDGMWVSFSPDGIQWTNYEKNPVIASASDAGQCVLFDARLKKYVLFSRAGGVGRRVSRCESDDFIHWTEPKLVFAADASDGPDCQIYGMGTGLYEGLYIGMPQIYHAGTNQRIDIQLVHSRDGIQWTRTCDRAVFLPNGPEGGWDSGIIFTACHPVVLDDRILIYYFGMQGDHHGHPKRDWEENKRYYRGSIGVATLRRDGWVSLDAGMGGGNLLTKPMVVPPPMGDDTTPRLILNTNAFTGDVNVTLLDVDGKPIPGFEKSHDLHGDFLRTEVTWPDKTLAELAGRQVRLKIQARLAKLYSFWFE